MQTTPSKRKPGRPVTHPPVKNIETGEVYETYTDAAKAVGGDRHGVRRVSEGTQTHHHGFHFEFKEDK
jgi:hypothetical protein